MESFNLSTIKTVEYDTVVVGGGFAGVGAAVASASNGVKTLLVECGGDLGGDITKAIIPNMLDCVGKGGLVRRLHEELNKGHNTSARFGARYDGEGNKIPGSVLNLEYTKYYLEKFCTEAGADILLYSMMAGCELDEGKIKSIAVATECGCIAVKAKIFIDATGNGLLAAMAGCEWEIGHPQSDHPQPASSAIYLTGLDSDVKTTDNTAEKEELKARIAECGIEVSAENANLMPSATDNVWMLTFNNQCDVMMDDPFVLSRAAIEARGECVEVFDKLSNVRGFEKAELLQVSSHIGVREGKRIKGHYRLTADDIAEGRRFDDAICTVHFPVDVHRISADDKSGYRMGKSTKPYHIPFRALIPLGCDNLLLAGRCISGDFYAHASYRVAGCVVPMGEAAGYAAATCAKEGILPAEIDTSLVTSYMIGLGYEI